MSRNKHYTYVLIIVISLYLGMSSAQTYFPESSWRTSTPEEQGLNSTKIVSILDNAGREPIDSFHIIHNGYLVYEYLGDYYDVNELHSIHSITKTISAIAIGIAIENGDIGSVDEKILDIIGVEITQNNDSRKYDITIEDILWMRSGIEWNEMQEDFAEIPARYDNYEFWGDQDMEYGEEWKMSDYNWKEAVLNRTNWMEFLFNEPMAEDPGTVFSYNTVSSSALSVIIEEKTTKTLEEYVKEHLFVPLGIENYFWQSDPMNHTMGGAGLWLTPFDMTKIGYLLLNNGTWDGTQIIPSDWIIDMTTSPENDQIGYGYHTWLRPDNDAYSAVGLGSQRIYVNPEANFVISSTCSAYTIGSDRTNYGCNYNFWKFIDGKAYDTEITTPTEETSLELSYLMIPIMLSVVIRQRYQIKKRET